MIAAGKIYGRLAIALPGKGFYTNRINPITMKLICLRLLWLWFFCAFFCEKSTAQFMEHFNGDTLPKDATGLQGWAYFSGDGSATIDFLLREGYASILIDATKDERGIWWALIKRRVSEDLNLKLAERPGYELRVEAKVKTHTPYRRINLSLNSQRTTDFHTNLMEFDLPDTATWYTVSFTTNDFVVMPGDTVYGQLALMDWGLGKYQLDIDYFKVEVVKADTAGTDLGFSVPYHPPVPDTATFAQHVRVWHDAMIDEQYPTVNLNQWYTTDEREKIHLITVGGTQYIILRWDFSRFAGQHIAGHGLLELTTHSVQRTADEVYEFGKIRVVEILGGDADWEQQSVTYDHLCQGQPLEEVLNEQMIIDYEVAEEKGGKTYLTISKYVLQRMLEGKTFGLAIKPLGGINAAFYAKENGKDELSATLHFTVEEEQP